MTKFYLTILSAFFLFKGFSQVDSTQILQQKLADAKTDSARMNALIDLHNATFKKDPDKSYNYALQILALGKQENSPRYISRGYRAIARCLRKKRDYKTIFKYDSLALKYAMVYGDLELINSQQILFVHDYLDAEKYNDAHIWLLLAKPDIIKLHTPKVYAEWYKTFGYYYSAINKHEKSIPYFLKAIDFFKQSNDDYNIAESKVFLAQSLQALGKTDSIAGLLFDALDIYTTRNSQSRIGFVYELLGDVFLSTGDVDKGIDEYLKARNFYAISNNNVEEGLSLPYLARAYMIKKNYAIAKTYIDQAEKIFKQTDYDQGKIEVNTLLGQYYSETNEKNKAEYYFIYASQLLQNQDLPELKTVNEKYWSQHEYRTGNYKKADSLMYDYTSKEAATKEPDELAKEITQLQNRNKNFDSNSIKILSILYTPGGSDFLKARLKEQGLYKVLHNDSLIKLNPFSYTSKSYDSAISNYDNNQLLMLETKYKTRQKDDSLRIAKQNSILADATIKRQSIFIVSIAVTTLLLAAGFFLQYKNRQRAQKDKARIEILKDELGHTVKNNLSIIKRFAAIAEQSSTKSLSLASLQNRITAIELLHKNLYQSKNAGDIILQKYIEEVIKNIRDAFNEEDKNVHLYIDTPVSVNMQTAEKIGLIINELVTNSFKYGFNNKAGGKIQVIAQQMNNKKCKLIYLEDGGGYNKQSTVTGYGSKLIEGIANDLNADWEMKTDGGIYFKLII